MRIIWADNDWILAKIGVFRELSILDSDPQSNNSWKKMLSGTFALPLENVGNEGGLTPLK